MNKYALVNHDIVIGRTNVNTGFIIPENLINVDTQYLRYDGINIVNAIDFTCFYIDELGNKHILENEKWQFLECKFSDDLILKNGIWFINNSDEFLTSAIKRIDDIAATVTQKWARFAEEYKEREAAAIAFQEAGFTGDVSVYISSFASVADKTNKEATLLILQQAQGLRALQEQLAVQRMRKYELKQPKLTIEQIQTLTDEICANIQALGDSYE